MAQKWVDKFESVQYNWCKAVLRLKGTPAAVGVRAELGLCTLQSRRMSRKLEMCSVRWSGRNETRKLLR